jgi:flagellar biosynthesis protein FlhG
MTDSDNPDLVSEYAYTASRLIVIGGGRAGVGKSVIAVNLATYLAQLGKAVILVDADPTGANLHAHFGLSAASRDVVFEGSSDALQQQLVQTNVPGLLLLPAPHDATAPPLSLRAGRRGAWLSRLRSLQAEYLVINVGPGYTHYALDVLLAADIAITAVVPEPASIDALYRLLRASYRRRMRQALIRDRLRLSLFDRTLRELGHLPSPLELVRATSKVDTRLSEVAFAEAQRIRFQLVVNQTRTRADVELGAWMSGLVERHYGMRLLDLGHIENDDAVWMSARRFRPLLVESPTTKSARNLERIARRILALGAAQRDSTTTRSLADALAEPSLYFSLATTRAASDEEVRRAYKKQREIYAAGGLATTSMMSPAELQAMLLRLDEAFDTLLDPVRRRAYDVSNFPDLPLAASEANRDVAREPLTLAAEQLILQAQLKREMGPETEFSGALLGRVRESQGIELEGISARTKIARAHLQAIEDEAYEKLPAAVYVRGFLIEFAKCLGLDPHRVQATYLRRMRDIRRPIDRNQE